MTTANSAIVSLDWLIEHFEQENLVILDASVAKIMGKEPVEYDEFCCIPSSRFCDLDGAFHDATSSLSHTMPSAEQFTQQVQKLGVSKDSIVVIYDNQGIYSAPRAWWMFKTMGFEQVYVLDGGLPEWALSGHDLLNGYMDSDSGGDYVASFNSAFLVNKQQILEAINTDNNTIVDARSAARFNGTSAEPRPGVRIGHIPSSINLHFAQVLTENGLNYKTPEELSNVFSEVGMNNKEQHYMFSCGSGMTACIVLLAAYSCGYRNLSLYDGSWSEWGADESMPIE